MPSAVSNSHRTVIVYSSSSDEESMEPHIKRRRMDGMSDMAKALGNVESKLDKIFNVSQNMAIPIAVKSTLYDTFKCIICHSPMTPPIIFAKCCKSIIGCQTCVDTWYRGEEGQMRNCPKCQMERGFVETTRIVGLDDFLQEMRHLVDTTPSSSQNQHN